MSKLKYYDLHEYLELLRDQPELRLNDKHILYARYKNRYDITINRFEQYGGRYVSDIIVFRNKKRYEEVYVIDIYNKKILTSSWCNNKSFKYISYDSIRNVINIFANISNVYRKHLYNMIVSYDWAIGVLNRINYQLKYINDVNKYSCDYVDGAPVEYHNLNKNLKCKIIKFNNTNDLDNQLSLAMIYNMITTNKDKNVINLNSVNYNKHRYYSIADKILEIDGMQDITASLLLDRFALGESYLNNNLSNVVDKYLLRYKMPLAVNIDIIKRSQYKHRMLRDLTIMLQLIDNRYVNISNTINVYDTVYHNVSIIKDDIIHIIYKSWNIGNRSLVLSIDDIRTITYYIADDLGFDYNNYLLFIRQEDLEPLNSFINIKLDSVVESTLSEAKSIIKTYRNQYINKEKNVSEYINQ